MAKFEQGNEHAISADVAREYQARSVESRKRNKTLRETLLAALMEDGGGGKTRLEHLVLKAMDNHRKGRLTFHDLKDLAFVLGEAELGITGGDGQDLGIRIVDTRKVHRSPLIIDGLADESAAPEENAEG